MLQNSYFKLIWKRTTRYIVKSYISINSRPVFTATKPIKHDVLLWERTALLLWSLQCWMLPSPILPNWYCSRLFPRPKSSFLGDAVLNLFRMKSLMTLLSLPSEGFTFPSLSFVSLLSEANSIHKFLSSICPAECSLK